MRRVLLWGFNKAQGFLSVTTWKNCGWFSREVSFSSYAKNRLSKSKRCRCGFPLFRGLPLGAATGGIRQESHWFHSALPHPPHQVQTCAVRTPWQVKSRQ